ncbi:MAG: N-acetyltransferase [Kordiimonadaceae bacterium]|nr:N-acetyltransferase [Kordiimonadaceae bacterium]
MLCFDFEQPTDTAEIDTLLDIVFGPDRRVKSSYALRENNPAIRDLSLVARLDGRLVGCIRYSKIHVANTKKIHMASAKPGQIQNLLLLGPLAVAPELHGKGVGKKMIERTLDTAKNMGQERVLLVGDLSYYGRFGFCLVEPNIVTLPNGKTEDRLLLRQPKAEPPLLPHGKLLPGWA